MEENKKKKDWLLIFFAVSLVTCGLGALLVNSLNLVVLTLPMIFGGGMCTVLFGIILITRQICKEMHKKMPSPFLLFGIMNTLFLLFMAGYGIYDILTDTGFMAGIMGFLCLVYVVPVLAVLLLANIITGVIVTKRQRKALHNRVVDSSL